MGPTDDHLPTVDPSIQQRGRVQVVKLTAGMETLIQVGALGEDCRHAVTQCRMGWSTANRVVSWSAGQETGRGRLPAMSRTTRLCWWRWRRRQLIGDTVSSPGPGKWGNKAELAAKMAHCSCVPIHLHGDPAAVLGCCTLAAAAAAAVGRLLEAAPSNSKRLERDTVL